MNKRRRYKAKARRARRSIALMRRDEFLEWFRLEAFDILARHEMGPLDGPFEGRYVTSGLKA